MGRTIPLRSCICLRRRFFKLLELECQSTAVNCYTAEDVESAFKLLEAKSATWSNCKSPPCNISKISLIFMFLSEAFNWPFNLNLSNAKLMEWRMLRGLDAYTVFSQPKRLQKAITMCCVCAVKLHWIWEMALCLNPTGSRWNLSTAICFTSLNKMLYLLCLL